MRILLLVLTICLFVLPAQAKYSGGSGTAQDPYQIATAADLIALGNESNDYDKYFILIEDINLAGYVFDRAVIAPDVNSADSRFEGTPFKGVFDGRGHRIHRLTISGGHFYLGLFGKLASVGEIRDTGLVDVSIRDSGFYVGGLVGHNSGYLKGCYVTGVVSGTDCVGGLVGTNERYFPTTECGCIVACHSAASVKGSDDVGGLVGWNRGGITDCNSTGTVRGADGVGGLAGSNGGDVFGCYSDPNVRGVWFVGGLLGSNTGVVMDSCSSSVVSGSVKVGGLVGYAGNGIVICCYSTGAVTGHEECGGLVGDSDRPAETTASFWDSESSGQPKSAGGMAKTTAEMQDVETYLNSGWDFVNETRNGTSQIWQMSEKRGYPALAIFSGYTPPKLDGVGTPEAPYILSNALELGAVVHYSPYAHYQVAASIDLSGVHWGAAVIPWFAGRFDGNNLRISQLTIAGSMYAGLFGRLDYSADVRNLAVVDVNIAGSGNCIGGLVGDSYGIVTCCCSSGVVSSEGDSVGGLIGYNEVDGIVTQSYSNGIVRGDGAVGGLVGQAGGRMTNCYSTCSVVGGEGPVGGLVGYLNPGYVFYCYCTGAVAGGINAGGLAGRESPVSYGWISSFWDRQTSGQAYSARGVAKTTAEMRMAKTFLDAGWDFVGETANGTEDIWWIDEGKDYPRLWWEQK